MQLTVKTLQQEQFKLEAEESDTILSLKEKIESLKSHPVANQKLIFSGKILDNAKTVKDYNISEKDFLVVMISKPKVTKPAAATTSTPKKETTESPKSAQETSTPTTTPAPVSSTENTTTTATATSATAATPATATETSETTSTTPGSQLVVGAELEKVIQNMMEMGFERDQITRALRASYNNPERAVEYLFNGIPESVEREFQANQQQQQQQESEATTTPAANTTEQTSSSPVNTTQPQNLFTAAAQQQQEQQQQHQQPSTGSVDFSQLRNTAQFQQLRQLVQSNPGMLQPLLQQVGHSNPELLRLINADPQGFLQALMEGAEDDDSTGAGVPQGSQVIQVTQEEKEAIDRLEGLGFNRALAIEAYFACDKNEELAANYLFDHGADDFE